ncbi:GNAT family N-acetyltransferase [Nocardia pseudovaccinii]|uniref:GNAT family N-acetyltransferase n=1 Tax=Nocardia pseudovaccinii TaxID=189540 RepID=UPI0007A3DCED|nr:GNAT family N-acetyltransferase [Nocardia pseudovaccinii]
MSPLSTLSTSEITADRLLLRKAHDGDREGFIELQTDPEVRTYLGGPRPRDAVERYLDAVGTANVTANPGVYVIADRKTNRLIGTLMLNRRSADQPGHLTGDGEELELTYLLRRDSWGAGLAFEAATTALHAAAAELPDQPVLIITRTANQRSLKLAARLGFQPISTFEAFGAEQTLATARLYTYRA